MSYIIEKYIKKNGQYNYAYVVMILNDNIYANPGIIFAESLKKVGCLCDIVALVNNKINKDTLKLLKNFYNKIIEIDTIEINHKNQIQNVILSKINIFKMTYYEKIFLVDVDTIIFNNLDNFFLTEDKNVKTIYMPDLKNYGFILIIPSNDIYEKCVKLISKNRGELKNSSKPFELLLNLIFKPENIKKLDFKISYDFYSNVDCIQYRKNKPFLMESNLSIEQRQHLDHFKVWFSYLTNIVNKYPEIKDYECIGVSLQVSKYFLASLSRFIVDFVKSNKNKKITNITNIYGTNNYKNLDYYHLDITKEYTNKYIKYNTDTCDLKIFLEYLESNRIDKNKIFMKYYKITSTRLLIEKLQNDDINLLNIFLNNYIKMFSNTFVIMNIDTSKKDINHNSIDIDDLKNNLVFRKKFTLNKILLNNIIFNLYQNFTYNQRVQYITNLINKSKYNVVISIYELVGPINFNDQNSKLDLFVFNEQSSKIRLSSIFFNQNTINNYNSKLNFLNIFDDESLIINLSLEKIMLLIYLQTIKKYIFSVYSGEELNNLCLYWKKYNEIILIDNNKHSINKIKNINKNKIFFVSIIFCELPKYKNILKDENINLNKIFDLNEYWEFEGIKIITKTK